MKASTLTELLVVMVLSSIVLLVVMDGLTIFRNYTSITVANMGRNSDQINNYMLMEEICLGSDSITQKDSTLNLYRSGNIRWSLAFSNSNLCLGTDTLFAEVMDLELSADRLRIALKNRSANIDTVSFAIGRNDNLGRLSEIEKNETKYLYE